MNNLVWICLVASVLSFGLVCYFNSQRIDELAIQNKLLIESVELLHKQLKLSTSIKGDQ